MLQKLALGLFLLISWGAQDAHAVVRITNDPGGRIGTYVDKYLDLRASGKSVAIDGLCASACTIVLGAIARDKICVTPYANLGFHAAWDYGTNAYGRRGTFTNPLATQALYSMYPTQIKRWITHHGGLTPRMIFLRGKQLLAMYRPCYQDANAQAR